VNVELFILGVQKRVVGDELIGYVGTTRFTQGFWWPWLSQHGSIQPL